jgi:hypothetical protein
LVCDGAREYLGCCLNHDRGDDFGYQTGRLFDQQIVGERSTHWLRFRGPDYEWHRFQIERLVRICHLRYSDFRSVGRNLPAPAGTLAVEDGP